MKLKIEKTAIRLTLLFMLFAIGALAIGTWAEYANYKRTIVECDTYNDEYGYYTEMSKGSFWSEGGTPKCLIIMEDGTKLPLEDYKTINIRQPMTRK